MLKKRKVPRMLHVCNMVHSSPPHRFLVKDESGIGSPVICFRAYYETAYRSFFNNIDSCDHKKEGSEW